MNKKKLFSILLILVIIGIAIYLICTHMSITKNGENEITEYTPQEEISDKQARETPITLYYIDSETNKLKSEAKLVNANELIQNPYKIIVEKLLEGPKSETLKTPFPENTRLIDANLTGNCVTLNFSDDILKFENDTQKFNIINCILNSLTQLTEVNSIKIIINNETHEGLNEEYSVISENT